ncbi:UNVERIFIED_CONTAM: hypothetical protein HHA_453460 [Hammondia hammondi]|eukprot:XP_008889501.1 hypothetical protein HHA_453460 [Hammondia hammondi]
MEVHPCLASNGNGVDQRMAALISFRPRASPFYRSACLRLSGLLLLYVAVFLSGCTPCESSRCATTPGLSSASSSSRCHFALPHPRSLPNKVSARGETRNPSPPLLSFGRPRSSAEPPISRTKAQRSGGVCVGRKHASLRDSSKRDSSLWLSEDVSACSGYLCLFFLKPERPRDSSARSSYSSGRDGRRHHSTFLLHGRGRETKARTDERVFAVRCPLLNVVDFARLRVPPLTAEALLEREGRSDGAAVQIHASISAAEKARAQEAGRKNRALPGSGQAEGYDLPPASSVTQLKNYHALLYYATWDSRCQALTNALANLASIACPTLFPLSPPGLDTTSESGNGGGAGAGEAGSNRSEAAQAGTAVSGGDGHGDNGEKTEDRKEGLRDILDSCIPCWLPITGICVSNSLVIAVGRRALQKQTRMLSNKKQLRHHERALHLMISEGIFYGSGHLPALQIWRREQGAPKEPENGNASSRQAACASLALHSSLLASNALMAGKEHDQSSDARTDTELSLGSLSPGTVCNGDPKVDLRHLGAGLREKADCSSVSWRKVFELRGFGPIPLMQLAGGDAAPWKEEEKLILTRALLHKSVESNGSTRTPEEGILSAGTGGFLCDSRSSGPEEDLRVWLSQLSSIYQYHAMRTLMQRLRRAEDEFPEFQEFNLRNYSPRLAKLKGLLKD